MTDIDEIRRQMAQIRHDMHYDVSHVVGDVEEVMDWRAALRKHPYIVVGVGVAVGYFLVPRRRREPVRWVDRDSMMEARPLMERPSEPPRPAKPPKSLARRAVGWAAGMLWPLVSQSAQNYAAVWLENQIKQHMQMQTHPHEGPFSTAQRGREGAGGGDDFVYRMPKRG